MTTNESEPYRAEQQGSRFRLVTAAGVCVLESGDKATIDHYADLLNKAYASGFKAGYRAAKQTG